MKIYLASSWRNIYYESVLARLQKSFKSAQIYDFKDANSSFHWQEIDADWDFWTPTEFRHAIENNPLAIKAFTNDFHALESADIIILLNPCGISAHMEAAWAVGAGKIVIDYYETDLGSDLELGNHFHIELMKMMIPYRAINYSELSALVGKFINESRKSESYKDTPTTGIISSAPPRTTKPIT